MNMPTLLQSLPVNDLAFLRLIASLWGVELFSRDPEEAAGELAEALCDADLVGEVAATLPGDGPAALAALFSNHGRMPWTQFTRQFGEVREMGPARRDREQPHLKPANAAEVLWYRGLVARAFFDAPGGPQEFAYIPDELFAALGFSGYVPVSDAQPEPALEPERVDAFDDFVAEIPDLEEDQETIAVSPPQKVVLPIQNEPTPAGKPLGRAASPAEKAHLIPATDQILDDACTLLAALRMGWDTVPYPNALFVPQKVLLDFLLACRLISRNSAGGFVPQPEAVKSFLEMPRKEALDLLFNAWLESDSFNELRQLPGFSFEGAWKNQPLVTREFLLNLLEPVPDGVWWSIPAFIRDVKQKFPDYQRPAGDYDSWFIKRDSDGTFLRGFAHWDDVDGALIRYLIAGPLYWLGAVELAAPSQDASPTAFRSAGGESRRVKTENGKIIVASSGKITVSRFAPRTARYQIARFCEWEEPKADDYLYRITTHSLAKAKEQGLKVDHLLKILQKYSNSPIPPAFHKALHRWEVNGTEAKVESMTVLRVSKPEILNELRQKAGRFLGEPLGPVSVVIKPGAESKVQLILAEMGILTDEK